MDSLSGRQHRTHYHDEMWLAIAGKRELACLPCCRKRIQLRFGRDLAFEDLVPCEFNLFVNGGSTFEELAPPELRWRNDEGLDRIATRAAGRSPGREERRCQRAQRR